MQRVLALPAGTILTGDDRELAQKVIAMHPRAPEKIGPGIDLLVIRENSFGRGHELHIIRTDGSEVDVSYRRALAPRTAAAGRADLLAALRQEVAEQIVRFKRDRLEHGTVCAVSGVALDRENAHVDHVPPWTFTALASAWLAGRPAPELESTDTPGRQLADRSLAADWQRFHRWSARLRLIHRDINYAIATARRHEAA
jgi:hypothetical protein